MRRGDTVSPHGSDVRVAICLPRCLETPYMKSSSSLRGFSFAVAENWDNSLQEERKVLSNNKQEKPRQGAVSIEMAIVAPALILILFSLMEFGHVYLTINLLNGAAEKAARSGITDGATTADVIEVAQTILASALPNGTVAVSVKDASVFDEDHIATAGTPEAFNPAAIDYSMLSDLELSDAESRQLFVVHLQVEYNEVGIVGPYFLDGITLTGQSLMRHE